jgi:pilus assembly protein CpaC
MNLHPTGTGMINTRCAAVAAFVLLAGFCAMNGADGQSGTALGAAQSATPASLGIHSANVGDKLHITVGRSVVLTSATPLRRVYIGNPAVLQSFTSGSTEVVLTAKTGGVSSFVMWDEAGSHRIYTVFADLDPEALRASLNAAFPGSTIHVETGEGKIFLTGLVATDAASDAAFKMASLYAKDVVNSLVVVPVHGKQVQL